MHRAIVFVLAASLLAAAVVAGCGKNSKSPTSPSSSASPTTGAIEKLAPGAASGQPGYEAAYYNGQTVTISGIEVPNHAPLHAQADLYEVIYPIGWQQLGLAPPQCNPCDHDGNGIDFLDFHDHVLDSVPGVAGFHPLWHVSAIVPAYPQGSDTTGMAAISVAYASFLPLKSEAAIDNMLAQHMPNGAPIAVEIDTQFYFLCATFTRGQHS